MSPKRPALSLAFGFSVKSSRCHLPLIRDLKKAGVEVFVCGQSLHDLGFKAEEVAEEVPVADSAMLVLVNKQVDGYAYIPAR